MKRIFLLAGLAVSIIACNNNTENGGTSTTNSEHGAHTEGANNQGNALGQNHVKNMHDAMSGMMQQMKSMTPTGDPDHDFAMMMKHHHQGAVDMAKAEIAGGKDETMKAKAQKMMDEQQKDIAEFDRFLQNNKPNGNSDFGKRAMGMMTEMNEMQMESSSLDAMFASMMIPHHRDGIKMAREYLKVGKNEEIKKMAKKIVSSQQNEVQELEQWLNNKRGANASH